MTTDRIFLSRWIGFHALGLAGIAVLVWFLAERLSQLWVVILAGPLLGIGLGISQSLSLQPYGLWLRGWALATVIGVIVGYCLSFFVAVGLTLFALTIDTLIDPVGSLMSPIGILYFTVGWFGIALLAGAIGAACIGVAQWFVLRNHYGMSHRWIFGHIVGGSVVGPLLLIGVLASTGVANFMWGKVEAGLIRGLMVALAGGILGVFIGTLTGPWLVAILRHPKS